MTNVFENQQGGEGNDTTPTNTPADQPAYEFIGEGKQYATPEVALAAIPHKDKHIATLEQENAEMRARLAEGKTLDDVISAVKESGQFNAPSTDATQGDNTSPQDVAAVVKDVLQQERSAEAVQRNVDAANDFMKNSFGEKAVEVAQDKANELGLTLEGLQEIAVRSPAAYQALFSAQVKTSVTTTKGDNNPQAVLSPELSGKEKYDNLRKTDKRAFLSPEVQKAQMAEAFADPEKYFGS